MIDWTKPIEWNGGNGWEPVKLIAHNDSQVVIQLGACFKIGHKTGNFRNVVEVTDEKSARRDELAAISAELEGIAKVLAKL